jgi:hypothetical protein
MGSGYLHTISGCQHDTDSSPDSMAPWGKLAAACLVGRLLHTEKSGVSFEAGRQDLDTGGKLSAYILLDNILM